MRSHRLALATLASALMGSTALPLAVQAAPTAMTGYYLGGHLGSHDLSSWPASVNFGGIKTDGEASVRHGLHGGLQVGRRTENARFEIEYQYGRVPVRDVRLGPVVQSTDVQGHYQAITLNALRTVPLGERWVGFAGVGLGWARAELPQVPFNNGCKCFSAAERSGTAYQARIGAEYGPENTVRPQLSLSWLHVPGPRSSGTPSISYGQRGVLSLNLGAVVGF